MKWFKDKEFACRCCGELPPFARENIEALVRNVLDPVREKLGKPIQVNSGYRCKNHNLEVGGVKNSQHLVGEAADIAPVHGAGFTVQELADAIKENGRFDQMIVYPGFVHVSWKRNGQNRKQVLRKVTNGYTSIK